MQQLKKVLSVVLVLVMLLSTMAMGVSATPANDKGFAILLEADKTENEIVPGAAVKLTIYFDLADWNQLMSDIKVAIHYDSSVYTPDLGSRVYLNEWAGYAKAATVMTVNANFGTAVKNASTWTTEQKNSFNSAVMLTAGVDGNFGITSKQGFSIAQDPATGYSKAQMTMIFNVTGDAEAVAAGNKAIAVCDTLNKTQYIKATDGSNTPKNIDSGIDMSMADTAVAKTKIKAMSTQIRYNTAETNGKGSAKFDARTRAAISKADFAAILGVSETEVEATAKAAGNNLRVGFVYASTANKFDIDAARAAAETGSTTGQYVVKDVSYIQRLDNEYLWTCFITYSDGMYNSGVNALPYIIYNGKAHFLLGERTTSFTCLYDTWSSKI